jgi:hypothetical protein
VTLRRDTSTMQHIHPEAKGVVPSLTRRRAAASSHNAAKRSKKEPPREMGVPTKRAKQPDDNGGRQRRSPVRTRSKAMSAAAGSSHPVRKDETAAGDAKASGAPAPSRGARDPARGPLLPRDPNRRPRTSGTLLAAGRALRKEPNPLRTDADRANDDDEDAAQLVWLAFSRLFQVQPPPPQGRPAKSADDIDNEVRVLVEEKLMHKNYSVKVGALGALTGHLQDDAEVQDDLAEKRLYQRAVFTWDGCHRVLLVLRQELDRRFGGPHRDVVFGALQFLDRWNRTSTKHRECTSRLGGVGTLVSAMRAFLGDGQIQAWAIDCLFRFTSDDDDNNNDSRSGATSSSRATPRFTSAAPWRPTRPTLARTSRPSSSWDGCPSLPRTSASASCGARTRARRWRRCGGRTWGTPTRAQRCFAGRPASWCCRWSTVRAFDSALVDSSRLRVRASTSVKCKIKYRTATSSSITVYVCYS